MQQKDQQESVVEKEDLEKPREKKSDTPIPLHDKGKQVTSIHYLQRLKKKNLDIKFAKFLEVFKRIHINIPFAEDLEQMPHYTKFLKDIMSNKRRMTDNGTINLTEECRRFTI